MKIYIVGSISSGKSTLAKKMSKSLKIPYQSLDEIVYATDKSSPWGNRKRPVEERNNLFYTVIQQPCWIIEDTGRPCFEVGLRMADTIVLLEISSKLRNYRIIKRWIKQRLGIEKCIYNPTYEMLICMLQWSKDYDEGKENLEDRIFPYKEKVITLRNNMDINVFIKRYLNAKKLP
jgi:adenylate kinase family enzyme